MTIDPPAGSTDPDTPAGVLDAQAIEHMRVLGIELQEATPPQSYEFPKYIDPNTFPPADPPLPETPIEQLRRISRYGTPAAEVLRVVTDVVGDLVDQVAEQRAMIEEQRGWMEATARKHGLTLEGDFMTTPLNQDRKPIPTPNRPDQTPVEQRPDCLLKARGVEHGPHGSCPGVDNDWEQPVRD